MIVPQNSFISTYIEDRVRPTLDRLFVIVINSTCTTCWATAVQGTTESIPWKLWKQWAWHISG